MKLVQWTRFSWDLSALPAVKGILEDHYHIRPATREEETAVRTVVSSAFALDTNWSDTLSAMKEWIDTRLDDVFAHKTPPCLVVTHGARIIGTSALDFSPDAETHLVGGPCILNEYRNRGLGTHLLYASLAALRDAGLTQARGITKGNLPVAKFVYSKFHSTSESYEFEPEMVRS